MLSSVNPITTRGADNAHHITASPTGLENPAAYLRGVLKIPKMDPFEWNGPPQPRTVRFHDLIKVDITPVLKKLLLSEQLYKSG